MSYPEAIITSMTYAKLVNRNNETVDVNIDTITKVIESRFPDLNENLTGSLIDSSEDGAYPILGYSYMLIKQQGMLNCESAVELYRYKISVVY